MTDRAQPGTRVLGGRYVLDRPLGRGGSGVVWRAQDRRLGRTVAVKLLEIDPAQHPETHARLRAEAAAAAKLNHPHVVTVYDIADSDDGAYLVMELVDGGTLEDVLAHGPAPAGVVAALGHQAAQALGTAHAVGLVHRDVKPANVLLTSDGDAKVADFGIARALGEATASLTAPGQVVGTARYLAPERLQEDRVDARADVYALGLVLHEMLTGCPPFGEGTTAEVAVRRLTARLPRASEWRADIPAGLDDAIDRATQLDPDDRFADGGALADALAPLAAPDAAGDLAARLPSAATPATTGDEADATKPEPSPAPPAPAPEPGESTTQLDTAAGASAPPGDEPAPPRSAAAPPDPGQRAATPARRWRWGLALAALAAVGVAGVLAFDGSEPTEPEMADSGGGAEQQADPGGGPVTVVDGGDHDPFGSGDEHPDEVPHAYDGDPATVWQTQRYRRDPAFGRLKPGAGVWFELEASRSIDEVVVSTTDPGASFMLFVGDAPPGPGAAPADWGSKVAQIDDAGQQTRVEPTGDAEGRVWLVWFTSLPADDGHFRATLSEVRFVAS